MYKKFIDLLRLITEELDVRDGDIEELLLQVNAKDVNLYQVNEELKVLERSSVIEPEESDLIKSVLVYLFMKNTDLEVEDIYALVYGNGKKITWH
ncbi:MAG: hypothetical protein GXO99_09160 [Nitrospirae bacterium]|nr:hypothetical protein [Nitrospirota bacterium]